MTEIKNTIANHNLQQIKSEPGKPQLDNSARDNPRKHTKDNALISGGGSGADRTSSSLYFSQSAFENKLTRHEDNDGDNEDTSHQREKTDHVLLVSLETGKPQTSAPSTVPKMTARSQLEAKVEQITKQITAKFDAITRPEPTVAANSATMNLVLDPNTTGLDGIKVIMNDGTLSVILARSADAVDQNIAQAALNLAQVLQSKFPKRTIKILESDTANNAAVETVSTNAKSTQSLTDLFESLGRQP